MTDGMTVTSMSGVCLHVSMVTCGSLGRRFGGVHAVTVDRLGSASLLLGPTSWSRFDDCVHVLHQLQLLPPEVFLLDKLPPGLLLLLSETLLLCFQAEQKQGQKKKRIKF